MAVFVFDAPEDHRAAVSTAHSFGLEEVEVAFDEDAFTHRDRGLKGPPEALARLARSRAGGTPPGDYLLSGTAYADNPREMHELVALAGKRCFARAELVSSGPRRGFFSRLLRGLWRS